MTCVHVCHTPLDDFRFRLDDRLRLPRHPLRVAALTIATVSFALTTAALTEMTALAATNSCRKLTRNRSSYFWTEAL